MGNKVSTPERICKLARTGDYIALRALLDDLHRSDAAYRRNRSTFLDFVDTDGRTPLVMAAKGGHYQTVELLIERGANLHYQYATQEMGGGSALHEAISGKNDHIVELLLRKGAIPFYENAKGYTAIDLVSHQKNITLLRRIDTLAPWRGWLMMKVPRVLIGTEWQRRYLVITVRYSCPLTQATRRQEMHTVLLCYKSTDESTPCCRAWLDGAKAREIDNNTALSRTFGRRPAQIGVVLHKRHAAPSNSYTTQGGPNEGPILHFRPDENTTNGCDALQSFSDAVNTRGRRSGSVSTPTTPSEYYSPLSHGAIGSSNDEEMAIRLQEEADAELAAHLADHGGSLAAGTSAARPNSTRPSTSHTAAPSTSNHHPPMTSAPSQDVGALYNQGSADFYPTVNYGTAHHHQNQNQGQAQGHGRPSGGTATTSSDQEYTMSTMPSAPPLPGAAGGRPQQQAARPSVAAAGAGAVPAGGEGEECVICMAMPRNTGLLHGTEVHNCVCRECAERVWAGNKRCPLCNRTIESLVKVY